MEKKTNKYKLTLYWNPPITWMCIAKEDHDIITFYEQADTGLEGWSETTKWHKN